MGFFHMVRTRTEMCPCPEKGPCSSKSHPVFISLSREAKHFARGFCFFFPLQRLYSISHCLSS